MPLLFAGLTFDMYLLLQTFIAALAFSLCASAVYLINDLCDVTYDRAHPTKRKRALASGEIARREVYALIALLLVIAFSLLFFLRINPLLVAACLGLYTVLNLLYSLKLKHKPIIDIVVLASGYGLRVAVGSFATGIAVSNWLAVVVLVLAFFLGAGKRYAEMNDASMDDEERARPVLSVYSSAFLHAATVLSASLVGTLYSLYVIAQVEFYQASALYIASVPLVILIILMYLYDLFLGKHGGDPTSILLNNRYILALCVLYVALIIATFYL